MPKPEAQITSDPTAVRSSYLGLFRAGMSTPEHRRYITVARQAMLQDAIGHLRQSMMRKSKHHFMFIGSRGSGKTHLLSLIEDEIAFDPKLSAHFVVVRFPEESNRILSFADFLLRLCEILAAVLPAEKLWTDLYQKLEVATDDARIIDTLVPAIRKENRLHKRTVLIMLENVHEVFEKQMKERIDVGALRKFLMDDNGCQLIATAPIHFDEITNVDQPFFDFFDVQVLDLLSKQEAIELVRKNLEWEKRTDLLDDFKTLRPKLQALHDMTAGNPRLTLMLYELIVHDSIVEVSEQFKKLLDRVTPFYQDRLKELAPRERALLETVAVMRDESEPKTPKRIAEKMRMSEQQTSSLLKRLTNSKYLKSIQNPQDKRSRLYSISEGFFDLWLAMNLSRKHRKRLPILVECLQKFYPQREDRDAKRAEYRQKWQDQNSQQGLAMLSDMGTPEERAQAKVELALRYKDNGNQDERVAMVEELRALPLDSMGTWIVRRVESENATIDYLGEIDEMLKLWSLHRSAELEAFMQRLSEIGSELNYQNYSEAKLAFLRDHLALVTEPGKRIELRLRIGNLLKEKCRWKDAENEFREALDEANGVSDQDLVSVCLNNLAGLLQDTNHMAEAESLMRRALAIDEQSYGADHPTVARDLNNLAQLLEATNRMAEAEPLMRRVLAINEQSYGSEHPLVAIGLNNLAQLLKATNRLAEAEPLIRRALVIGEQSLSPEHAWVSNPLNNLAELLQATNRLAEAEPLYRRALTIDEQSYGAEHPSVARDLNNLAALLLATNRLAEAEPKMRRALAIEEQSYGAEHPRVALGLNNLAQLLKDTNRLAEAEPLMRRALAISKQSYGVEHPLVAATLSNLAQLLQDTNRLSEAEPLMRRALAIDEQSYGPEHPSVARDLTNLARLLQATNRLAEAEPLFRRAIVIDEQSYGADHPRVALGLSNLAQLLQATNRLAEAEPLMRRALVIDEQSYGAEHPSVAIRLNNLTLLLQATNRLAEAESLMRRALAIDEQSYGPEHPAVATSLNNLAQLFRATNRLVEAEPLMARVVSIFERSYGENHPDVAAGLNNLAQLLWATNRLAEAEPQMARALLIFFRSLGEKHPNTQFACENYQSLLTEMGLSENEAVAKIQSKLQGDDQGLKPYLS